MKRTKKWNFNLLPIILLTLLIFILNGSIPVLANSTQKLFVDYCNFKGTEKNNLEVYCQISNSDLSFVTNDSGFNARFEISALLYDTEGNFIEEVSTIRKIQAPDYETTLSANLSTFIQLNFHIQPGEYKLKLDVTDLYAQTSFSKEQQVKISGFSDTELMMSDIQVASRLKQSEESTKLVKSGYKVLTNPTRTFDSTNERIFFYFEAYHLSIANENKHSDFQLEYSVQNENNEIVKAYSNPLASPKNDCGLYIPLTISSLKGGEYSLSIKITDNATGKSVSQKTNFRIYRSPLETEYFAFEEILEMLAMVADEQEMTYLKQVNETEREDALKEFWKSKDQTPATDENELMNEFYQRIAYAEKNFTVSEQPGWKTDRGKVLVKYGEPDMLYKAPSDGRWQRYERWVYTKQNLTFMFVDQFGFGNYRLAMDSFLSDF